MARPLADLLGPDPLPRKRGEPSHWYQYPDGRNAARPLVFPGALAWDDIFARTVRMPDRGPGVSAETLARELKMSIPTVSGINYMQCMASARKPRKIAMPIGPYCGARGPDGYVPASLVQMRPELCGTIAPHLIFDDRERHSFEATIRDGGTVLITLQSSLILGGPWLAILPDCTSLPDWMKPSKRDA
jgi:hypothetical protein